MQLMENDKNSLEEALTQIAEEKDEVEADRDVAILNKEDLTSRVSELEKDLEQTQDKLQVRLSISADICIT